MLELKHDLRIPATRDEKGRRNFVSGLRSFVLHDMAAGLRHVYAADVEPSWRRRRGRAPRNGPEVHDALRSHDYFRFYSALRVTAQDMVYQTVRPAVERSRDTLRERAARLATERPLGSLRLNPTLPVPRSVSAVDVHLMPGSYHSEDGPDDLVAGSVYDNRLAVSSFGLMGHNLDDIGQTVSHYVRERWPQFAPRRILDVGCTVGHNTGPWADQFPEAELHAIDVAAPCLRYALARARSQGRAIHFHQMNAEALDFPDASFDVVFSSMFLHEVPRAGIARVLREAHRVLRPGGLMVHMELPPNGSLAPFDAFYLDWDGAYNNEPFYKPFRDLDPRAITQAAGFPASGFVEFALPSWGASTPRQWRRDVQAGVEVESGRTGRLASGVRWYCFGRLEVAPVHDNERLVQSLYEALGRRDGAAMTACYASGASFSDPVFPALCGAEVGAMWRMLCARAAGIRVEVSGIVADEASGRADWQAWYAFSGTGRPVHNVIHAEFRFRDGRILTHVDDFDLWRWSRQALGAPGLLLGWSPLLRSRLRAQAASSLQRFSAPS